jgi:hypothetical protein
MAHVHVSTISVFEVKRIIVRWVAEHSNYAVIFEGGTEYGVTTVNAWPGYGQGPAPELIVERAPEPVEPPTEELDL